MLLQARVYMGEIQIRSYFSFSSSLHGGLTVVESWRVSKHGGGEGDLKSLKAVLFEVMTGLELGLMMAAFPADYVYRPDSLLFDRLPYFSLRPILGGGV
uniref:Uncharacterized protein n=1 Tax=Noccaea caerulescens TaxID=107243 RepID=A0A1J3I8Z4_NOCCA